MNRIYLRGEFPRVLGILRADLQKRFRESKIRIEKFFEDGYRKSVIPIADQREKWIGCITKFRFTEGKRNLAFGILPRRQYRLLFDIDPEPQRNTLVCTVYAKEIFPIVENTLRLHATYLRVKTLVMRKAFESGALSLESSGGELSEVTGGGELALSETEKKSP